jgi:hypothetical protein
MKEINRKRGEANKGHIGFWTGKSKDEKIKQKISKKLKGRKFSEETKNKMCKARSMRIITEDMKDKISSTLMGRYTYSDNPNSKKVICIDDFKIYNTMKEACERYGCSPTGISNCCTGRSKSTKGYHFIYYDEYIKQQLIHNENLVQAI